MQLAAAASRSRRVGRFLLPGILMLALGLRVTWAVMQSSNAAAIEQLPDQSEYLSLARNLLAGQGLRFHDDRFGQVVYAYRMPGYPAFLAACQAQPTIVRIAQAVIDATNVLAVWLLARMLLPRGVSRIASPIAAAMVALNPFLIFFTSLVLSDTLYTAALIWGVVLMLAGARGGSFVAEPDKSDSVEPSLSAADGPRHRPLMGTLLWLAGGAVLAASGLIRPSAIGLGILLALVITLAARPAERARSAFHPRWPLPTAATMVLLTAAALAPWAYRNSVVLGQWVWTTTNGGITAYDGWNPDATGASDQSVLAGLPQLKSMTETERSDYLAVRAADWAKEDWGRTLKLGLIKAGRTWSPVPLSAEYGNWKHMVAGLLYSVPIDLLAIVGLFWGRARKSAKLLLPTAAIYFTLVHMASVGSLRYRLPVEPMLAVLAALGVAALRMDRPNWRRAERHL